jgi:hypothetical protein
MNIQKIGFGQIDINGVKSALIHSAVAGFLTFGYTLLAYLNGSSFNIHTAFTVWGVATASAFLKKLGETYEVSMPLPPFPTDPQS